MKIATILGARPQFIKASMVSRAIMNHEGLKEVIIHTGQHFDNNMSQIFFEEMKIPQPNYNLDIHSLSHGAMTGRQLEEIEKVLTKEMPDCVLVYGDTNSTLAGALAATKLNILVAHVESGLRSFNRTMPEEINRILTDHIAELLFTPTEMAVRNLKNEGINVRKIKQVGDVMYDAALYFGKIAENKSKILEKLNLESKQYILTTVHRQENTDDPIRLKNIFSAFSEAPMPVIIPLHPRTKKKLDENNISLNGQIKTIDPLGYLDMVELEKNAHIIATDSGGIQKEAFFYGVPCITLREETEWIELVKSGANILVGSDKEKIMNSMVKNFNKFSTKKLYGEGTSANLIVEKIIKVFN